MKATGIVRKLSDLGHIVIPKEIRRTLHIRQTDPWEIFTAQNGEIILKKYSPIGELGGYGSSNRRCSGSNGGLTACVCDGIESLPHPENIKKILRVRRLLLNCAS